MISMGFDAKMVTANLPRLDRGVTAGVPRAILDAALELLRLTQFEVPHDEGTLQNSGNVDVLPNGDVVMGYHTPYAARLHEHPEYRFQRGRKGKYISDPLARNASVLGLKVTNSLGGSLGGGLR